jgi:hypothetical protein
MKTRPIIFSGESVRAIFSGVKTQTRRIVKPHPYIVCGEGGKAFTSGLMPGTFAYRDSDNGLNKYGRCPYGVPGERLWVRETWNHAERTGYDAAPNDGRPGFDESDPDAYNFGPCWYRATDEVLIEGGWKPSIFMPRAASRITLEIVSVRVERLQEISEEDAIAEGYREVRCSTCRGSGTHPYGHPCRCGDGYAETQTPPKEWYRQLWETIHGAGSWDLNPWVWVVEFERVEVAQ